MRYNVIGWYFNGLREGRNMANLSKIVFMRSTNEAWAIQTDEHTQTDTYTHTHTHTHTHHTYTHTPFCTNGIKTWRSFTFGRQVPRRSYTNPSGMEASASRGTSQRRTTASTTAGRVGEVGKTTNIEESRSCFLSHLAIVTLDPINFQGLKFL